MTPELKIKLLKRKFQSLGYIEEFIENYQTFLDTGLKAFHDYKRYRQAHPNFVPDSIMETEEFFWEQKVKPNFLGMLNRSKEAIKNARQGQLSTVASLAGSFHGLSRGFDGVQETFMDVVNPEIRKKYLTLWDIADTQAGNIKYTINDRWKNHEILNERITGPIDEQELLTYLQPGETAN